MTDFGYAGSIMKVDLSSGSISSLPSSTYADRLLGGRGIAAGCHWDEVPPGADAFDPVNRLVFAVGPLAGLSVLGSSRWQVSARSPASTPERFSYCNLGGVWGAELKFCGYDALVVHGRSEQPVYLFLHDGTAELRDASSLWGKGAIATREMLKRELGHSAKAVAIGPAGENKAVMATLLADNDASGSGGLGAVMGAKKLKAIVVKAAGKGVKVARPEELRDLVRHYRQLARSPGTASAYRYDRDRVPSFGDKLIRKDPCYGCLGCFRRVYAAENGTQGKFMCASALFYQPEAVSYYGGWTDVPFYATKLCDDYGVDTKTVDRMICWLQSCYEAGIVSEDDLGIPLSKLGSLEFIETLVRKLSLRHGIGDVLAGGLVAAAASLGPAAVEQLSRAGYLCNPGYRDLYGPRLYITNAFFYAMEPRLPMDQLHEVGALIPKWVSWVKNARGAMMSTDSIRAIARRFWGGEPAVDFSTSRGKALAARMIQDRQYAKECLILCDYLWPVIDVMDSADHVGDPSLESRILSAVTGQEVDEDGLYLMGERVFNLQRAILAREGHRGRESDILPEHCHTAPLEYDHLNPECLVPGKDGEVISRKGKVVDRNEFERLKDEYYTIRGWDASTGLQTAAALGRLGLSDVAADLDRRGLLGTGTGDAGGGIAAE